MRTLFTALVVAGIAPLFGPSLAAGAASRQEAKPSVTTIDLKSDIDGALRWLRGVQDPKEGSYGASVETTAWVLRAMVESPRRYQRSDGPFVARALDFLMAHQAGDGSIRDARTPAERVAQATRIAAAALTLHADESTKATVAKALVFIAHGAGDKAALEPGWGDEPLPASNEALYSTITALLAQRGADGTWDGDGGRVLATARNAVALCRAYARLKPADPRPPASAKPLPRFESTDRAKAIAAMERGAHYLAGLAPDGKFGAPGKPDPGTSAMAIGALLALPEPRPKEIQASIDGGLAWLVSLQRADGSIHDGKLANYVTSASIMALARSGRAPYLPIIAKARDFLVSLQTDEADGYSEDQLFYGGIGYGSSERPDLSNLQMALEALNASGLDKDHAAFKRALKFLERCQNRSESNDVHIVDGADVIQSGDDGGSAYAPGQSNAGFVKLESGVKVPRSYGSMTYALLKAYIFAGLPKDDPRMKATWEWLRKNYTLDVNPGFDTSPDPTAAYQGLYYYFHTMAKALDLYGDEEIVDAQGIHHAWRKELAGRIVAMQRREDGSWINENSPRWWEGNPTLATAYALLTLGEALPGKSR